MKNMLPTDINEPADSYSKISSKSLKQQIDVVAEFHAYKIHPLRIAYRTGIDATLVQHLVNGEDHQRLFKAALARHRKSRRDQRLHKSLRHKGIAQTELQHQIEQDYKETTGKS
ncbi:MAG: hypothetical protein V7459_10000 [Oceanicoccus sp.]